MITFKRSKNIQEIIRGYTIKQGKNFKESLHRQMENVWHVVPQDHHYTAYR